MGSNEQVSALLFVSLATVFYTNIAGATTYYVATTGSDAVSCATSTVSSSPKRSIASAISCLSSGDTLRIGAGTYSSGNLGEQIASGSSLALTKIIGAGMGKTILTVPRGQHGVYLDSAKRYIEMSDFTFDGSAGAINGIYLDSLSPNNLIFARIEVKYFANQGVQGGGTTILYRNLDIHHIGQPLGSCYDIQGRDGYCHGMYLDGDDQILDGISLHDNNGYGVQFYPGGNGFIMKNSIVYRNNGRGIHVGYESTGTKKILNNTVYQNRSLGIAGDALAEVKNNISYLNSEIQIQSGKFTLANNYTANPNFVDPVAADFRLRLGSPAIDNGANLVSDVLTDIDGVRRPQGVAYDIGAYEYAVASSVDTQAPTVSILSPSNGALISR